VVDMGHVVIDDIAARIGKELLGSGISISTVEACTGGAVSAVLTLNPGSGEWFDRGFVAVSDEAKKKMLGVKATTLKKKGAVSQAALEEMIKGAIKKTKATLVVAVGNMVEESAATEGSPAGLVWLGWALDGHIEMTRMLFPGDAEAIRRGATALALQGMLVRILAWKEIHKKTTEDVGEEQNVVQ